jgi:hypothetical protein
MQPIKYLQMFFVVVKDACTCILILNIKIEGTYGMKENLFIFLLSGVV